jgi:four helix bundle protein
MLIIMKSNSENIFKFEELKVYQKALDFIDLVYDRTKNFPAHEIYGVTSQYPRAAQSIALNIAEGSGGTPKEFRKFLRTSRNSVKECIVCITVASRRQYLKKQDEAGAREKLVELSKMLSGLISSI